jgi:hypothetical protein
VTNAEISCDLVRHSLLDVLGFDNRELASPARPGDHGALGDAALRAHARDEVVHEIRVRAYPRSLFPQPFVQTPEDIRDFRTFWRFQFVSFHLCIARNCDVGYTP